MMRSPLADISKALGIAARDVAETLEQLGFFADKGCVLLAHAHASHAHTIAARCSN